MKNYLRFITIFTTIIFSVIIQIQATVPANNSGYFTFVVIETTVTKDAAETSSRNPEEHRYYVSNVIEFPGDPQLKRRADQIVDDYFTKAVVNPMKAKGFQVNYYMRDVRIDNGAIYTPATKAESEALREKTLKELKDFPGNVFTFVWQYDVAPTGMETAMPELFLRDKDEPFYGETGN